MGREELVNTFLNLAQTPSPSGSERDVAMIIKRELELSGIACEFDSTSDNTGSNTGNLIAKISGTGPMLMFVTHMDTVEEAGRPVKPVVNGDLITSSGDTILGADNKAGVAALICAMKEMAGRERRPNVVGAFTTKEEVGLIGAKNLSLNGGIDYIFVVDGSDAPGKLLNRSYGHDVFEIKISGREAHAAKDPEKGANAILAASIAVSKLNMGRDSDLNTLNIGVINGGRATNLVPANVTLKAEVRSFSKEGMSVKMDAVKAAFDGACRQTGCTYEIKHLEVSEPFYSAPDSPIVSFARDAASAAGVPFVVTDIKATTEANALAKLGIPILGVCRGGRQPHSVQEHLQISELVETQRLLVSIMEQGITR